MFVSVKKKAFELFVKKKYSDGENQTFIHFTLLTNVDEFENEQCLGGKFFVMHISVFRSLSKNVLSTSISLLLLILV